MHGTRVTPSVVAPAIAAALVFCVAAPRTAAGLEGTSPEPSIREMLDVIEAARRVASGSADRDTRRGGGARPRTGVPTGFAAARRPQNVMSGIASVDAELSAARARAAERAAFYRRHGYMARLATAYVRVEDYPKAARVLAEAIGRETHSSAASPVKDALKLAPAWDDRRLDAFAWFETMHARTLARLGTNEAGDAARRSLEAARERLHRQEKAWSQVGKKGERPPKKAGKKADKRAKKADQAAGKEEQQAKQYLKQLISFRQKLEDARRFVLGHEGSARELAALSSALARLGRGGPPGRGGAAAAMQWRIVEFCRPAANRAVRHLRWLEALLVMRARYPGHPKVRDGSALWELFTACREFELHEKCAGVLDEIIGMELPQAPVAGKHALWKPGAPLLQKAESYVRLGLMREELGDPRAREAYQNAVETFELFRKTYPEHKWCQQRGSAKGDKVKRTVVDERTALVRAALARVR